MVPFIILGVVILIALAWFFGAYNRLVTVRNTIPESWHNVDTELQRRYDLIPNLVETVKGYAAHEKNVFEEVTRARAAAAGNHGAADSQAADENALVRAVGRLFAVAEGYPELKASRNFLQLQEELVHTEDRIQAARRFYNGNVRTMNNLVEMFPSNMVAGMFGFKRAQYFEIESVAVRQAPSVSLKRET